MNKFIRANINFLLKPFDLTLQDSSVLWERNAFASLYESRTQWVDKSGEYPAECVIFSKDRALQLHALLTTYQEKVASPVPLYVLYHTTNTSHQKAYEDVITLCADRQISFIKQEHENSFRKDLLHLLEALTAEKVFFLVDDIIFTEEFNMADLVKFDMDKFVPSLRMGANLRRCYTINDEQPLPSFMPDIIKDTDKIVWRWDQGAHDWSYPVSLDGHFFSTREITTMIRLIDFSAPNTLEDQLQKFRHFFSFRLGVAYKKSKIVNIPCNKVQKEIKNLYGDIHQDFLLERWQQGYQLDIGNLYGFINESAHQEISPDFTRRACLV
ncbi:MAG: hypothetical protein PHY29_00445 [Syntrophales bacterium]|nr:hypothetical protein [Syntrophales bacterium]